MCVRGGFGNNAIIALAIFGIIFAIVAILVVSVGYIALLVILGVGLTASFIYSLVIFIRAFVKSAKSLNMVTGSTPVKTFFLRWGTLIKDTTVNSMIENFAVSKNALLRSKRFRIISLGKWCWLLIAIGTLICGTVLICALIAAHVCIAAILIAVAAAIVALICIIVIFIGLFYAIVAVSKSMIDAVNMHDSIIKVFNFTTYATFSDYASGIKAYFETFADYIKLLWENSLTLCKDNISLASTYGVLSPKKYFLFLSIIAIIIIVLLFTLVLSISMILLFVVMAIVNIIWTSIISFVNLIRK